MAVPISVDEIMKYVQNCQYPTNNAGVMKCAEQNQAPHEVLQALKEMPEEAILQNVADVREGIRRHREHIDH